MIGTIPVAICMSAMDILQRFPKMALHSTITTLQRNTLIYQDAGNMLLNTVQQLRQVLKKKRGTRGLRLPQPPG